MQDAPLTNDEIVGGLKEALKIGVNTGSGLASKVDGFYKNPRLFIPFPQEVQQVEGKLRQLGFNKLCDDFTLSLNRGAEEACKSAAPIFVNAITSMTFADALGILKGGDGAATNYLKKTCTTSLVNAFKPTIKNALDKVSATKYWTDVTTTYNKIPLVEKVNTDLPAYVTDKAVSGLFLLITDEENKIRKDPFARTSDLLKKVFAKAS